MEVHTIHYETIDSTNKWAKSHANEFDPKKITCIFADQQTDGRGRFGRKWVSKKGNLHMTLFYVLDPKNPSITNLAQISALSCARVLLEESLSLKIKWPNDLIFSEKKFCGTMAELIQAEGRSAVIIGIGMNVNAPVQTDQQTTSLKELTQREWDLETLREKILFQFLEIYQKTFKELKNEFETLLAFRGDAIRCHTPGSEITGICKGVNDLGQLLIETEIGQLKTISSGDIERLRKL